MKKFNGHEFILQQTFNADELDYQVAEYFAIGLRHSATMTRLCYWIFDFYRNSFYYISENSDFFSESDKAYVQENGYDYLIQNVHPDDVPYLLTVHKTFWSYLEKLGQHTIIMNFKICYTIRLKTTTNHYALVSQQAKPIATDSRGNVWLTMGIFQIISPEVNYRPYIQNTVTNEKIEMKDLTSPNNKKAEKLTGSELMLLKLLAKDLKETEIADKMNISRHTVRSHRKKLYRKLHAINKGDALKHAFCLGLL